MYPVAERLAAGHCDGMVSVLNCSKPGAGVADSATSAADVYRASLRGVIQTVKGPPGDN
jgi:hypothetical protein